MTFDHSSEITMSFDTRVVTGVGVLAAVTEAGSFARAAETLGLTPSGVSRAIARLEGRVGVRLFDRTPRSVTLTEEGHRFYTQVMPLLASIEEVATDIAVTSAAVGGRLRVNVDPWFARMVLAPRLPRFMSQYPLLSVEMTASNHREDMMTGADVAVRFGPTDDSSLIARKLLETRVLTCAAPAYIQKHGVPSTPHDLIHHEALLFRDPQTGRPFPWEFARKGKACSRVWSWDSAPGLRAANSCRYCPIGPRSVIRSMRTITLAIIRQPRSGHFWIS